MISFQFDPCEILGVPASASLQEIRDAYRSRAKTHHPDAGGEPWAFRVLSRSYEILSQARVASRAWEESDRGAPPTPPPAREGRPRPESAKAKANGNAGDRRGVVDAVAAPSRLVAVETLVIRFEEANPHLFLLRPAEERNLSCTLQVLWPTLALVARREPIPDRDELLEAVAAAFASARDATRPTSARSGAEDGRFCGWLTYPTFARADAALQKLRAALGPRGMGVHQTVREHFVPRDWAD